MNNPLNPAPLDADVFGLIRTEKRAWLLDGLNELTRHHAMHCPEYAKMMDSMWRDAGASPHLESVPWIPVRLFKLLDLK